MCDRSRQVIQFRNFFRNNLSAHAGLPQVYLVHGEAGQSHDSLIERLIIERIEPYATAKAGKVEGVVRHIKPWLDPLDDFEEAKETLKFSIFEEVSVDYEPTQLSIRKFCDHRKLRHFPFVVIQHDFDVEDWALRLPPLIEWYLTTYWASAGTCRNQIMLFLNFIYPDSTRSFWQRFSSSYRGPKQRFGNFLRKLSQEVNHLYPCLLVDELGHLDQKEVCRTLIKIGLNKDGACPDWVNSLFKQKRGRVRMEDVERLIIETQSRSLGLRL